jgi:hypothetical protein
MAATQGRSGHRLQVNVATTLGATMPQAAWNLQCGATRAKGRSAMAAALVAIICGVASASTVRNRCADKTSHDSVRSPLPALAAGLVDGHRGGSATACRSRRTPCRSRRACSRQVHPVCGGADLACRQPGQQRRDLRRTYRVGMRATGASRWLLRAWHACRSSHSGARPRGSPPSARGTSG